VAEQNKVMAETHLATVTDKLKVFATTIESHSMHASDSRETPEQKAKPELSNPWLSGSFYLFAVVVVLLVLAVINVYMSWYTLVLVPIACVLITVVIGSLQLRNDKNLSEDKFVRLIVEALKRLSLFDIDNLPEKKLKS
jgi:Flp pilus assembly protein TadB